MSDRQFRFGVSLTVGQPHGGSFFGALDDQVTITGHRVSFRVVKTVGKEPNTCDLTVYNLAPTSRRLFARRPLLVRLDCGYDGRLERVFTGDVVWSESRLERATWETRMMVGDGARAYRLARANRSFKAGVTLRAALNDLARDMGLRLPLLTGPEFSRQFPHGISLHGPARREMARLLAPYNMEWSVQDGRLQILRERDVRTNAPVFISADTGLIGSPEFGAPPEKKQPPVLRAACSIRPELTPGGKVQIESVEHKGVFKLRRVEHAADTHGSDHRSDMELLHV